LRRNSECSVFNSVIAGYPVGLLLENTATHLNASGDTLRFKNSALVAMNDTLATTTAANPNNTSGSFNIDSWYNTVGFNNTNIGAVSSLLVNSLNLTSPNLTLGAGSPLLSGASFSDSYVSNSWFTQTTYRGAFDGSNDWTDCWASWDPQNEAYLAATNNAFTVTATASGATTFCQGGSVVLNAGSYPGATFAWSNGGTSQTTTITTSGTYSCIVTKSNGCVATSNAITVVVNSLPTVAASAGSSAICIGNSTTLTGSGATTYAWMPGSLSGTSVSVSPTTSTTYTVTGTNSNGCTNTGTVAVAVNSLPTVAASTSATTICNGGSATLTGSGATTYSWTPGPLSGTSVSVSPTSNTTYTVVGTNSNGCVNNAIVTVSVSPTFTLAVSSQTNVTCNAGNNGAASISASGGTGALNYAWTPSGGNASVATGLTSGTYTCTITDVVGCTGTRTVNITQPSAITSSVSSQTNLTCNGGSNGSATISASGGTGTLNYNWSPVGGTTPTATGLTAQNYTVTITDANSCVRTQTLAITQPTAITSSVSSQTNVLCNGANTGSATILASGGTGVLSYNWVPSGGTSATATGLTAGLYAVTITDANTCTRTQLVSITQPTAIVGSVVSSTNATCGNTNGAATISASGGTGTLSYNWLPVGGTASSASGLGAGSYTVTVTDLSGCTRAVNVSISNLGAATVTTASQTNITCNGGSNGAASVNATGGTGTLSYNWTPGNPTGDGTNSVSGLTAGTWTCTVTDQNSCVTIQTVVITQPAAVAAFVSAQTNVGCNGGNDGSATISASGGTGVLTYAWLPTGGNTPTANGLNNGTYTCTITDASGCSTTQSVNITEPSAITTSVASASNETCFGSANGSATINATGGTGTLSYTWAPAGGISSSATGLTAATYTVTVTDVNSCSATQTLSITSPAQVAVTANASATTVCAGTLVTLSGSGSATTYTWDNSVSDSVAFPANATTTYMVTGTDASGCTNTDMITITVNPLPTVNANASATNVCAGTLVTLTGSGTLSTYVWDNSVTNGVAFAANNTTLYTLTGTDGIGCSATDSVLVTVNPLPVVTFSISQLSICQDDASLNLSGLPSGGTFSGPGVTGSSFDPSSLSGLQTITYTYTDSNSCVATSTDGVTVDACVGVVENGKPLSNVAVYPNPTMGDFTLDLGYLPEQPVTVEVFNSLGQTVEAFTMTSDKVQINLSEVQGGIYSIRITDGAALSLVRVIRQ